jgi:hypothetical protein
MIERKTKVYHSSQQYQLRGEPCVLWLKSILEEEGWGMNALVIYSQHQQFYKYIHKQSMLG